MPKEQTIRNRLKLLRQKLNKKNLNCLLVTQPANITYLTGFTGDDSWVIITARNDYLLTDSRYTEQAQKQCPACKIIERAKSLPEAAAKIINSYKSVKTAGLEIAVKLGVFRKLKNNIKAKIKTEADLIENIRTIKDKQEIKHIEAAAEIAAKALNETQKYFKPTITENQLAGRLDFEIRKLGAKNCFETIIAFGPNGSRPHHQPGKRKLKKNDTILIDFGVKFKSYCCDITRCFAIGKPSSLFRKVYRAVKEAQAAAINSIKPGVELSDVDTAARGIIAGYDLPVYKHGTGHGLGLEVHEKPFISKKAKTKIKTGMLFTIEPGIYIPSQIGIRIEDDVLVTKTGCKVLSKACPK